MVVYTCDPSTYEAEAGGQGSPRLHTVFEVSLCYMRPHLKNKTKQEYSCDAGGQEQIARAGVKEVVLPEVRHTGLT